MSIFQVTLVSDGRMDGELTMIYRTLPGKARSPKSKLQNLLINSKI